MILCAVVSGAPHAAAQTAADRETARTLMDRGDERLEQGQPEEALALYLGAHQIMHVPTTGIEVARTYAILGKLVEARDAALEVLRVPAVPDEPNPFRVARAAAEELARKLAERIPQLRVQIVPREAAERATLNIDGRLIPPAAMSLPQALNPTEHLVQVTAPGFQPAERRLTLASSERKSLLIMLEAAPSGARPERAAAAQRPAPVPLGDQEPAGRGQKRLPWPVWLGIGVGGAGLATGTVAGIISLSRYQAAKRHCDGHTCTPEARRDRDASMVAANVSNVGFALGAAGAVLAVTSWWISSRPSQPALGSVGWVPVSGGGMVRWQSRPW
jgi:hypothetical protein